MFRRVSAHPCRDRTSPGPARRRRAALAVLLVGLFGCATPPADRACVTDDRPPRTLSLKARPPAPGDEPHPRLLVDLAEPIAPAVERTIAAVVFREGRLAGRADVMRLATGVLRPMDVVVVANGGRLSGHMLPGRYSHAAVYVGSEKRLRSLGLWSRPELASWRDGLHAGRTLLETDQRGVHLATPADVLDTDRFVILRPRSTEEVCEERAAILRLLAHGGCPFDFHFDLRESRNLFCVELVSHALPDLEIGVTSIYGRPTLTPDSLVRTALAHPDRLEVILAVTATPEGTPRRQTIDELRADLAR